MKNVIKLLSILLFVSSVMFTSCDKKPVENEKDVASVTLNPSTAMLALEDTLTLVVTVLPTTAVNKAVTWTSSDTLVATVNNGKVTAIKVGTATITVTTEDGGKTASCLVTVSIRDGDGNVYKPITIGNQTWLLENLKTTKYNDGTTIALVNDNAAWASTTSAAFCWYGKNESNKNVYGALYNYYAVENGKICPKGWRVPFVEDWVALIDATGKEAGAGMNLKEEGTAHWLEGGTNQYGFTALPGGQRLDDGTFEKLQSLASFWTNLPIDQNDSYCYYMKSDESTATKIVTNKKSGASIRCIKNDAQ